MKCLKEDLGHVKWVDKAQGVFEVVSFSGLSLYWNTQGGRQTGADVKGCISRNFRLFYGQAVNKIYGRYQYQFTQDFLYKHFDSKAEMNQPLPVNQIE